MCAVAKSTPETERKNSRTGFTSRLEGGKVYVAPGPHWQAGDLGMGFFPEFWKVPDVQPLMTHIEATSKPILESITAETGVIWPPLEEFEAEWAHLQKGENKRTVPQRAEPFRNAHNCSLTRVYLGTCSGTDYKTATVEIVRSGTVYCSGTVYTVLACTGWAQPRTS